MKAKKDYFFKTLPPKFLLLHKKVGGERWGERKKGNSEVFGGFMFLM